MRQVSECLLINIAQSTTLSTILLKIFLCRGLTNTYNKDFLCGKWYREDSTGFYLVCRSANSRGLCFYPYGITEVIKHGQYVYKGQCGLRNEHSVRIIRRLFVEQDGHNHGA